MKFIYLNYTIQWFLVELELCNHEHNLILQHFNHSPKKPCTRKQVLLVPPQSPQPYAVTSPYSVWLAFYPSLWLWNLYIFMQITLLYSYCWFSFCLPHLSATGSSIFKSLLIMVDFLILEAVLLKTYTFRIIVLLIWKFYFHIVINISWSIFYLKLSFIWY